jgi:hypothetical protein
LFGLPPVASLWFGVCAATGTAEAVPYVQTEGRLKAAPTTTNHQPLTDQNSTDAENFTKRGATTEVGVSHVPFGLNAVL